MFTNIISREDESIQSLRLMTTTASTPATPGPSTPTAKTVPLTRAKIVVYDEDEGTSIDPPARPSSTPFPQQELLEGDIQCTSRSSKWSEDAPANGLKRRYEADQRIEIDMHDTISTEVIGPEFSPLCNLPIEIHEHILDYLFGFRNSASGTAKSQSGRSKSLRNWSNALRHARRREVSDLALVSEKWRHLIQDRLYRHIKIKATRESVDGAALWFLQNPHLCPYVKHIEYWFPVFQQKPLNDRNLRMPSATRPATVPTVGLVEEPTSTLLYQSPSNNCALEEVFRFTQLTFSEACVLTLEGGDRKKPPKVRHFSKTTDFQSLPVLGSICTLVCKGQWNLIRTYEDFKTIVTALPNLSEWHGAYAKPKSKSYLSMGIIFPNLPYHLTNVNICLENDFRREVVAPAFFRKVAAQSHFCLEMAKAMPALEHFQYTGRVCRSFFDMAATRSNSRTSRLKTIELVVKNICRPCLQWNDGSGSGITDKAFIHAFEALVHSGIRSLDSLTAVESLGIKFIDLDSTFPSWNPYFQLEKNRCTGLWSDQIIDTLARTRPSAVYLGKSDLAKGAPLVNISPSAKSRPLSIKVSEYLGLPSGITIT